MINIVPPGHPCRFPFLFFFVFFFLFFSSFSVSHPLLLFRSFLSCRLVVFRLILYRLLRFYFRFRAFLRGRLCYSVISSRRCTPPALLASLKYAYSPCVLSSFFLAWLMSTYLYLFFSSFPFSISIWTSFLFSSCPHLVGTMLSPRLRFLLRLV